VPKHFDVAVIGSGPGGYVAALKAAQLGARVAVVEQGHLGGTCLNDGCIPSKVLLASAELLHRIAGAEPMGIRVDKPTFDWTAIQKRKDKTVQTLRGGVRSLFKARKVALYKGRAVLSGRGRIVVTGDDGAGEEVTAEKIILAVGSVPSRIPGWPQDGEKVCTSDESLHWKRLPGRLLIVGGGYIGCEFACMMHEFGVRVTLLEMLDGLLPSLDAALGAELARSFAKRGIECITGAQVEDLTVRDDGIKATIAGGGSVEADRVLVAIGRSPNTADLGLESVAVTTDGGFVRVNDRMETPADGIYCIGDANGRIMLAHAASAQGIVAAENALGATRTFDAPVPGCIFTFPEVATVGLSQEQARERRIPLRVGTFPLARLGKAMAVGETEGFVKVLRHRGTGDLLGVHMLGHGVTECIAAAGALLGQKASVEDVAETVFAHPTMSEALRESAEDTFGRALHLPPRKVLRVVAAD
jgi:dihydrolipoamide dehydrogenase